MNKKLVYGFFIIIVLILIAYCINEFTINKKLDNDKSFEGVSMLKINIDGKDYIMNIEKNETTKHLVNILPKTLKMSDLNYNEKYIYLDESLPKDEKLPRYINAGDVMLFGDNCLVIFYKSFDTVYKYTKIGHIDNLPDLGSESVSVTITK